MLDGRGHRRFIIPAEITGFFKTRKRIVHFILLLIFLALPWIRINGEQALLLNLSARQFHILGLHLMAYDAPIIFFVLLAGTIGLALVTALWGRVWCGWACPQTVFIESLYRQIEIWTEGNYIQRRKFQTQDMSFQKFWRAGLKSFFYFLISFIISHSFLAYWTGSQELVAMMAGSPRDNQFYFMMVMAMTLILMFNFGWFREQFCLIVCPYGRIQSVFLDSHTVTVMYDEKRGEPRKGVGAGGDCVNCNRCVQVCPTGIDIRNGIQMECIGCTACVDACDDIMKKVKKPEGLIRYKALTSKKVQWFRARILFYIGIFIFAIAGLAFSLNQRSEFRMEVLRNHGVPYVVIEHDGVKWVRNNFILRVENQKNEKHELRFLVEQPDIQMILPENPFPVKAGEKRDLPLFLELPQSLLISGDLEITVKIQEEGEPGENLQKKIHITGPRE